MNKAFLLLKIFLFTLCLTSSSFGQYSVKVGGNFSNVKDENNQWKTGLVLGVGLEKKIYKDFSLAGEIYVINKKGIIKELPVYYFGTKRVNAYDFMVSIYYLEIPLILNYKIPISKKIDIRLFVGPSLSIPIFDKSLSTNRKFLFYFDEYENDPADYPFNPLKYTFGQESKFGIKNLNYGFQFGTRLNWDRFSLDVRYRNDIPDIGPIRTMSEIDKHLHTIYFLFGINF